MQFNNITSLALAFLASSAIAAPVDTATPDTKDGGSIASCETQTAANQVACISACNKDAACITSCTATAVAGYTSCAGV